MFFLLSNLVDFLIMPLSWVFILLIWAAITQVPRRRKRLLVATLIFLTVTSNSYLAALAFHAYERRAVTLASVAPHDIGIILGGVTSPGQWPQDRTHFNRGADRVTHGLHLYKLGKVKKLLVTGGTGEVSPGAEARSEAEDMAAFLQLAGVPPNDLILEEKARNTRENALFSGEIIEKRFPGSSLLLITSAFHMPRAEGCFEKVGLQVDTFSTDQYTLGEPKWDWLAVWPSVGAFSLWDRLLHELCGVLVYKVMGYI